MRVNSLVGLMILSLTATVDGSPYPPPNNQNRDLEAGLNLASSIINALSGPTYPTPPYYPPTYPPNTPFIPPQQEQLVPAPNNPGYYYYPSNPGQLYYYPGQQPQPNQAPQQSLAQTAPNPNQPVGNPQQISPTAPLPGSVDSSVQQTTTMKPQASQNETPIEHPDKPGHFFYPSNNKQLYIYVNKELVPLEQKKKERLIESTEKPGYYYYPSDPKTLIKPD